MRRAALLVALLALSGRAAAHSAIPGLGHFTGGMLHPLIEPTHLIAIVVLGLVIGQRGIAAMEPALASFVAGLVLGLAAAGFGLTVDVESVLLGVAGLAGLAVAASVRLPQWAYGLTAALLGTGVGLGSRPESVFGLPLASALVGAGLGASLWLLCVVAVVNPLRRPWLQVLVRVLGSWATASSVLVLALWVFGRHALPPQAAVPVSSAATLQLDTRR